MDSGKLGAISFFVDDNLKWVEDMPLKKSLVQKELRVFKNKDPKFVYKSGKNKGLRPTIIKRKAKYKTDIDFKLIAKKILQFKLKNISNFDKVVLLVEEQYVLAGRGFGKPIYQNLGALQGLGYALCDEVITILPVAWKKFYKLSSDKSKSVKLAKAKFPEHETIFLEKKDGRAESALIGLYHIEGLKKDGII
jgi:hypothetical protein